MKTRRKKGYFEKFKEEFDRNQEEKRKQGKIEWDRLSTEEQKRRVKKYESDYKFRDSILSRFGFPKGTAFDDRGSDGVFDIRKEERKIRGDSLEDKMNKIKKLKVMEEEIRGMYTDNPERAQDLIDQLYSGEFEGEE